MVLGAIVTFGLLLSLLVLIHELGHYLAARWAKVKVEEFGLGYPPRALTLFKKNGTIFSLNWIPFGGFVKMEGEDEVEETASPSSFNAQSMFKRLVVILAGAGFNFIFGIVAFSIVFSMMGIPRELKEARVGMVQPDSPAAAAGLPAQVNVIAIRLADQTTIATPTVDEVITTVSQHKGEQITVVTSGPCNQNACQEMAQEFTLRVRTVEETPAGQGSMGVVFQSVEYQFYPWYEMPVRGVVFGTSQALQLGWQIVGGLSQIIGDIFTKAKVPSDLSGPVGIVHQAQQSQVFEQGWLSILGFAGMLSINLGVMNILPIPALDGGRAAFILLEKVFGKKRIGLVEGYAHYGGYIFLVSLIVLVTMRDVWRLFAK